MWFGLAVGLISAALAAVIIVAIWAIYRFVKSKSKHTVKHASSKIDSVVSAPDAGAKNMVGSEKEPSPDPYKHLRPRFRAVGVFVAAAFSVLGAKIFSMQILSGDKYTRESSANATTTVKTPAPRGYIKDANGTILVKNRSSLTVLAEPEVADNSDTLKKLSVVLGLPYSIIKNRIKDQSSGALSQRVVASDITRQQAAYLSEHSTAFNGVTTQLRTVRDYPYGALASHLLGYTGEASLAELAEIEEGREVSSGDVIGKSGVEATYDSILCGDHGERVVVSDADGNIVSVKSEINPTRGSDLYLTVKAPVQYVCDKLLAELIAPDGTIGKGKGTAGSIVVIDITDGSVIALANYPTYRPDIFTNGISQDTWSLYNTDESYYPLLNRAIAGEYPAASTFKAFSGSAGLKYGYTSTSAQYHCTGSWDGWNSGNVQRCWLKRGHGNLGFRTGIVQSCDVVFYEIGKCFFDNKATVGANAMQNVFYSFGFGKLTNIDLSGEEIGRVPTPEWKAEHFKDVPTEATFVGGDYTNMAIGQGYVLVTPIQLACAYGSIVTGKLVKPHLLQAVKNSEGSTVVNYTSEVQGSPDVDRQHLDIILDALRGVATENSSVARYFQQAGVEAYAKTGTAEVAGKSDYAWTAAIGPFPNPKYAVACIVEEGGGGADAASPIASKALAAAVNCDGVNPPTEVGVIAGSTGKSVKKTSTSSERTD